MYNNINKCGKMTNFAFPQIRKKRRVIMNKTLSCCFTGHRDLGESANDISSILPDVLTSLYDEGYRTFLAGGALGFDTLAAKAVIELRRKKKDARLELILPCRDQSSRWSPQDIRIYNSILALADKVTYISNEYTRSCMYERNRALVDSSNLCIAYCKKNGGGSHYTCEYAEKRGVRIVNLANILG